MSTRAFLATTLLCLSGLCLSGAAQGATLTKGPYLQAIRTTGVVVAWETDAVSTGALAYGQGPDLGGMTPTTASGTHHSVALDGLPSGTLHHYRVQVDGAPTGEPGTFVTLPVGQAAFSFLAYGDNRSDHGSHAAVIDSMLQHPADFVVNTGDMVSSGEVEADWQHFFEIEAPLLRHTALFPVIGNHEEDEGAAPPPYERLLLPPSLLPDGSGTLTYYSFWVANSHFIVLDHHVAVDPEYICILKVLDWDTCFNAAQMDWLETDLAAAAAKPSIDHVFVFVHPGPYSSKPGRSGSAQMRALLPLFAESKVKLVVSGHDHYYEHGVSGNGVHYIISGGGGAGLYETDPGNNILNPHEVLVSSSVYNFIKVSVAGPNVKVDAYEGDGSILETFEIGPKPDCLIPGDCVGGQEGACEGHWTCDAAYECQWICDGPPTCDAIEDCGEAPEDAPCEGAWDCLEGGCAWVCTPTAECDLDEDCADKPALNDCFGGHHVCSDGDCEWRCDEPECQTNADCFGLVDTSGCPGGSPSCVEGACELVCPDVPEVMDEPATPAESAEEVITPAEDVRSSAEATPDAGDDPTVVSADGDSGCAVGDGASPAATSLPFFLLLALLLVARRPRVDA